MALRIADRIVLVGLILAALLTALAALDRLGDRLPPVENLERLTLDLRFKLRGSTPPGDAVAIVAIDDATLTGYPRLLERRAAFAELVDTIAAAKPAVIGIDAVLADPEHLLGEELEADIRGLVAADPDASDPANRLLQRIAAEITGDARLVDSLRAAGNVVLGFTLGARGEPLAEEPALRKGRYDQSLVGARPPAAASRGLVSLPAFNAAASALGMITVTVDQDQTARELIFARRYNDAVYAPLAVPLLAAYDGAPEGSIAYLGGEGQVRIGDRRAQLHDDDRMILNFRGVGATFPTYSAGDVLDGRLGAELAGKIVLVGITYLGHDRARTPFDPQFPAIELHATAIDNLLAGDPIRRASPFVDAGLCGLFGLLAALLFIRRLDAWPLLRFGGIAALALTHAGVALVAFTVYDLWLSVVWPLGAVLILGGLGLGAAYAGEAKQRRWLRRSFGQYLGGETLDQLLADPGGLALGGARRELSVLFSDIRDFTTISEHLSPEELVELLNLYLTPMSDAVLRRGGYLDKYIGDAVMAVYGAPVPHRDHADRCLGTAIAMQRAVDELNPTLTARGLAPLEIGVGVNSGEVVVGNMGSAERFDYTVIGDAVNLASRLEGLTKIYGARCLVGEATQALCSDDFVFREVDRVRVKGKGEAVALFELLRGPEGELARYDALPTFAAALSAYRSGDFPEARRAFAEYAEQNPDDRTAALYRERLHGLGDTPPADWDGVTTFRSK